LLAALAKTGCLFVTTAVEALDDESLAILDKGHTRADFMEAVSLAQTAGLTLSPTFVTFAPWTTIESYAALLEDIVALDLVGHVSPVQLAIRLLVPRGSLLAGHPAMEEAMGEFDPDRLSYQWRHVDPGVDALHQDVQRAVEEGDSANESRQEIFARVWALAQAATGANRPLPEFPTMVAVPHMSEPWYCCAEPTDLQRNAI
jgi:hypothetical protein